MSENPLGELTEEFKKAPTGGKVLAVVALVAVCGVGLYSAMQAKNATGGTAPATALGIDPNSLGTGGDYSGSTLGPFNINPSGTSTGSTAAGSTGSNTIGSIASSFVPKPSGVSGYETGNTIAFYNNGTKQGVGNIGDTSNLAKTVKPAGFAPTGKGISGYESNGFGVVFNNGSLQSVVSLPRTVASGALPKPAPPAPIQTKQTQPGHVITSPIQKTASSNIAPPKGFTAAKSGVSGFESGNQFAYYNNGSLQGVGTIGNTSALAQTTKPKNFTAAKKGVSGYESNGYAVAYNNGNLQSVLKLTGHA